MLHEIANVRQIDGEPQRRWFADDYFDLGVWDDTPQHIVGFQLCHNRLQDERALTWMEDVGFSHGGWPDGRSPEFVYMTLLGYPHP